MKKIFAALLCVALLALFAFAQTNQNTRPRIDPSPSPTPGDSGSTIKKPPTLIGGRPSPTPTPGKTDAAGGDDEVIRVETNLVTIPVSVLDRDGRFIAGLRQQDFQVLEDNAPQKIEYFAPVEQPFTVVLLLDVSNSTQFKIEEIQTSAIAFVNQLRPDDRVIVISFDEKVHVLSPLTNNRYELRDAIRRANFGGGTSLYEAVDNSINQQLRRIQGRKAIVLFTDGVDTTSRFASYQTTVKLAEESESLIYPIRFDTYGDMGGGGGGYGGYGGQRMPRGMGGILGVILGGGVQIGGGGMGGGRGGRGGGGGGGGSSRAEYETGRRYLSDLARNSGGRMFEASSLNNLDAAFSGIAEELRRQYTIGYYPENAGNKGDRRHITVRVTGRQNAVVRAKNSYIVGENEKGSNTATTVSKPRPKVTTSRLPF
jgi:Ca-activated chloride channel homolog